MAEEMPWHMRERLHLSPIPEPTITDDLDTVIGVLATMLTEHDRNARRRRKP
jgi:hypothetical protein